MQGSRQQICNNITLAPLTCIAPSVMTRLLCAVLLLLGLSRAQAVDVLASIRPLALVAQAVMGPQGRVQQLVPDGASSHDYVLRPSGRRALTRAEIILWVGPAHERFLIQALAASPATVITAQTLPGMRLHKQRRLDGSAALAGTVDAHLWLDPDNAVVVARALAEALGKRDPAHAAIYRRNAAILATQMAAFKARHAMRFQGLPTRSFIAYHDAYQYVEPVLGLNYRGSLVLSAEGKPSAKHFLLMSLRAKKEGISCFLGEPGFDEALARHMFNGRPANAVAVDELFIGVPFAVNGYEAGLTQMAEGIYRCLGGK